MLFVSDKLHNIVVKKERPLYSIKYKKKILLYFGEKNPLKTYCK